ncbi:MAG: hypothetical protein KJO84_02780 [Acidimicrobiia bacterium]|nr:hypothetical protein [Acidimicrobiia bacterium]
MTAFPHLSADWEPTRATLHAYAQAIGSIPRAFLDPHPKWWHVSLKVGDRGLVTDPIPVPDGSQATIWLDVAGGEIRVEQQDAVAGRIALNAGRTAREVGEYLTSVFADLGRSGEVDKERFANDDPRPFDPVAASAFWESARLSARVFEEHRASVDGDVGIVQLWPHGFDLSTEWFGTRVETYEEEGELKEYPSQLNLGFYPGGRAYFYSNPWPFESSKLLDQPLPHGAQWHTEGWEGSILYHDALAGDADGPAKLAEFAAAVHAAASPTLLA